MEHMTPEQMRHAILNGPAMVPPPGVTPNFVDPPNLRNDAASIFLLIVATMVVWLRVFTKFKIIRKLETEDYCLLAAWAVYALGFYYYVFKLHLIPTGVHQWNLRVKTLIENLRLIHRAEIYYALTMIPLKTAIILQCLRVFVPIGAQNSMFWCCHILIWINALFWLSAIFAEGFSCSPRAAIWDVTIHGKCINRLSLHYISAAFNSAQDIMILILPQRAIWALNTSSKRKLSVSALFMFGLLACIASLIRLYYTILLYVDPDVSYHMGLMGLWTEPELTCGFVAASVPIVPRFVKYISETSSFIKLRQFINSTLHRGSPSTNRSTPVVPHAQQDHFKPNVITDVEFHSLVVRTNNTNATGTTVAKEPSVVSVTTEEERRSVEIVV